MMRHDFAVRRIICALALTIALIASCAAAEVQELSIDNNGRAIAVTRYAADGANPRPAVLVLHGSGGIEINPDAYARHAQALAENGIDAYLVRYFGKAPARVAIAGTSGRRPSPMWRPQSCADRKHRAVLVCSDFRSGAP